MMTKKTTSAMEKQVASKMKLAVPVSQRVELDNILLAETVARRKPLVGKPSAHTSISVNVQTTADKRKGNIQVQARFVLVARLDDAGGDELLRIEAIFLLHYRVPSFQGLRKANVDAFGEMNGLYNAWPFWREFVQATTVRMGFPALTIPVYRPVATVPAHKRTSSRRSPRPKRTKKKRVAVAAI